MYQFIHIETYARTVSNNASASKSKNARAKKSAWTCREVANEADRVVGSCNHVENPQAPKILFGMTPSQAVDFAESEVEKESATVMLKSGKTAVRRVRSDKPILMAGVASYPKDGERYDEWKALTLDFLKNKYGKVLRSVIEHTDEEHPHIHFYVVADNPSRTRDRYHDGFKESLGAVGVSRKADAGKAYREGMKDFQMMYWEQVASKVGMAKDGPKKTRLTREEWLKKQQEATDLAAAIAKAQASQNAAIATMKDLEARGAEVEKIAAQVAKIDEMSSLHIRLLDPQRRLAEIVPGKVAQSGGTTGEVLPTKSPFKPK